ncbi:methyl-accepting chemotaxis protein [Tepidibacter formicigenes]|jgi:methyl-accepting chemotaxis protein|uniref:Methyl-accepting chemotaxis protein n=1 Tax=Tepidibacter formicigenes DSM 15518 TaxID=1123349 RepID=A0A1M6MGJ8_9FIRM|nr:methyl-accepting chemotaxis protein [Tepidibacter formicigenes]SHJ82506.1 Methyl-accepting chemotaxis protein [Tepidibacter formicigenes DSM 15518]
MNPKFNMKGNSIKFKITAISLVVLFLTITTLSVLSIQSVNKSIKNQMKEDGMALVEEIVSQLENSNLAIEQIDNLLGGKVISVAHLVAHNNNISNEYLIKIAERVGVSEINVTNPQGVIIYSNLPENVGYEYPQEHSVYALLRGEKNEVIEKIRKSDVSNDYYKYGAVSSDNGGIVQVGIHANEIENIKSSINVQSIVEKTGKKENIVYALVIDKNLKAIAHSDTSRIGIDLTDKGSRTAAVDGKPYTSEYIYKKGTVDEQTVYDVLLPLYRNGNHIGAVNIGISMKNLDEAYKSILIKSLIVAILSFVVGGFILVRLIGRITNPFKNLAQISNKVSDGDLTQNIEVKSNDEIGILASSFNKMIDNLRNMTSKIQEVSANVSSYSQELLAASEQASTVSEQIAISTQDIADGAENQARATNEVLNNIKEVVSGMDNIKEEVTILVNNSDDTSKIALEGREKMKNMVTQIHVIKNSVNYTSDVMNDLEKASDEIGNILQVINDIADQTNLLALNAAIEAARAGESGKGFAVVADEIRKLAEQSMKSADQIRDLITKTQENTKKALVSIEEGNVEAQKGEAIVKEVGNYLKEILDAVDITKDKLYTANENVSQSNTKAQSIVGFAQEIERIATDSAANTQEVAASSEEQSATIEQITRSVEELSSMARDLEEITKKFKLN